MSHPFVAPQGWQPPPARPALTARQKAGARLAGIIGFLALTVGFALLAIPLGILAIAAFFAIILDLVRRSTDDPRLGGFMDFVDRIDLDAWILPLVGIAVIGVIIMVAALVGSARILRAHGVNNPWGVTWAGAGIAVVGSWIVSSILSFPLQVSGSFVDGDSSSVFPVAVLVGGIAILISLATTAVVGWLAWWWMAHALRDRPAVEGPAVL